ncbi:unnamed protein product [Durusdinium trenchii]|uniref:Uncharacterized protein n=1 Tax=Durusdinium trenchii TaxID=1381693 RepID=A0ABP0I0C6_9DINO
MDALERGHGDREETAETQPVVRQSFYSGPYSIFSRSRRPREDSENAKLNRRLSMSAAAKDVLNVCIMHHSEFDTVNFVTAFHRMAKVPDGKAATGDPMFLEVVSQLIDRS